MKKMTSYNYFEKKMLLLSERMLVHPHTKRSKLIVSLKAYKNAYSILPFTIIFTVNF